MDSKNKMPVGYTELLKQYRTRFNQTEVLENAMKKIAQEMDVLKTFQTCLSIGTGYGEHDIEFIKICLPNLKKLIVVEMNPDCVKELKVNLKSAFGDKLEVEIYETTIETFTKSYKGSNIDIVIGFPLKSDDLGTFLGSFFNSWCCHDNCLAVFIFNSMNDDMEAITRNIDPNKKPPPYFERFEYEIKKLGLFLKRISNRITIDLRNFGEDVFTVISSNCHIQVTREVLKEAIKKALPDGWGSFVSEFCVVAKLDF